MNPKPRKEIDTSTYTGRFAERLRMLREKKKMSVEEFSEKSGIPKTTIFRWEAASNSPPLEALPVLAKNLGVTIAVLLPKE